MYVTSTLLYVIALRRKRVDYHYVQENGVMLFGSTHENRLLPKELILQDTAVKMFSEIAK